MDYFMILTQLKVSNSKTIKLKNFIKKKKIDSNDLLNYLNQYDSVNHKQSITTITTVYVNLNDTICKSCKFIYLK